MHILESQYRYLHICIYQISGQSYRSNIRWFVYIHVMLARPRTSLRPRSACVRLVFHLSHNPYKQGGACIYYLTSRVNLIVSISAYDNVSTTTDTASAYKPSSSVTSVGARHHQVGGFTGLGGVGVASRHKGLAV